MSKSAALRSSILPKRKSGTKPEQTGLGAEFRSEVSLVIDRLGTTPLIYQIVHRDIRRAIVRRFPYLIWYRVAAETVIVLACTYAGRDPERVKARLR